MQNGERGKMGVGRNNKNKLRPQTRNVHYINIAEDIERKSTGVLYLERGKLGGKEVSVLRDTGCTIIGCRKSLVNRHQITNTIYKLRLIDGAVIEYPTAYIEIDTQYVKGVVLAALFDDPVADLIIGNVGEDREAVRHHGNVITRAQRKRDNENVLNTEIANNKMSIIPENKNVKWEQEKDPELGKYWEKAKNKEVEQTKQGKITFHMRNGYLYRKFTNNTNNKIDDKLVIPFESRGIILQNAHESALAGHRSVRKTKHIITSEFFWPKMNKDITEYVKTCPICQKARPPGKIKPIELGYMQIIGAPFKKVAIDIVGPLPMTNNRNRYILTLIDMATRWPEAVPLKKVTAEDICEALYSIFTRMGFPEEILSDNGPQFSSELYVQVCKMLNIKISHSSIYHPQSNGMVERLNGTLKTMLRKVVTEGLDNWDTVLQSVLFAYREVPNETTLISPYELMFGRKVRGPMAILRTIFTHESTADEINSTYDYIIELRNKLKTGLEKARANTVAQTVKNKTYYDRQTVKRDIHVGDKVLLLNPKRGKKLALYSEGPYEVTKVLSKYNVEIKKGNRKKIYHLNRVTRFMERNRQSIGVDNNENITHGGAAVVITEDNGEGEEFVVPTIEVKDKHSELDINNDLERAQKDEIKKMVEEFTEVISDIPGKTTVGEHIIKLVNKKPITLKPYTIPSHMAGKLKEEINLMLKLGIIEESKSPYSSPLVLIKKKDGSVRTCVDYRKLNKITRTVAEVIPNPEDILNNMTHSRYFSKLDLTKGYWQIPLQKDSQEYTAFQGPDALYQFKYMPFGLSTAPATFNRIMRKLFGHLDKVETYFDDICVHTEDWETHIKTLRQVFETLKEAGFTVKPGKMEIGKKSINFLGHRIGGGLLKPESDNVQKVLKLERPTTKKQVRSLVGLISYYNKFIPNFSTLTAPLTDLTRKGQPNKIRWTNECQQSLDRIQKWLSSEPILILPDNNRTFIVRTDASMKGIGACLLQSRNNTLHPVKFISRKLMERETRYSTIERECLAIIWAVQKLSYYLLGSQFILQCDHQALKYLNTTTYTNSRITRWSLILQEFKFDVQYIKGEENVIADCLSRLEGRE